MNTEHAKLLKLATHASVATASVLIVGKLAAWLATGSVSVMASLMDSILDAGASLINLFAVRYSLTPADETHRFGHGKAEALAALGQATFISGSAVFLLLHAVDRLLHPQALASVGVGVGVMIFSIAATLVLLAIQRHVIRKTHSTAIRADALHYATDLAANSATLAALMLAQFGFAGADPVFAIGIGLYILYSAYQIGHDAVQLLMDRELPAEERERILELARTTPGVLGAHELRTRQSGQTKIIQLHLELDDRLSLVEAHHIAMEAERRIKELEPHSDIIIHQDPASLGDETREH